MFIDNFASVDDFLSCQHHAAGDGNARQQVGQLGFATLFVVDKVGLDVFVEVAFLKKLALRSQLWVLEKRFVGRKGRKNVADGQTLRLFSRHQAQHVRRVFHQNVVFGCIHDSSLIKSV